MLQNIMEILLYILVVSIITNPIVSCYSKRQTIQEDSIEIFDGVQVSKENYESVIATSRVKITSFTKQDSITVGQVRQKDQQTKYNYKSIFASSDLGSTKSDLCASGLVYTEGYCDECGVLDSGRDLRIVGGTNAVQHSWPSNVYIQKTYTGIFNLPSGIYEIKTEALCGGTLINRYTILSSAQCDPDKFGITLNESYFLLNISVNSYYPTRQSMFKIYVGIQNTTNLVDGMDIDDIIIHPNFDSSQAKNDIALFLLNNMTQLTNDVVPACLPKQQSSTYPDTFSPVYAVGWGLTSNNGQTSNYLQNVELSIYDTFYCQSVVVERDKNWDAQICAGDLNGLKSTCYGDTGGGMYIQDTIGGLQKYVVAGITSYSDPGCAQKNKANVFTRVSYYLDWIKSNWKTSNISTPTESTTQKLVLVCFSKENLVTLSNNRKKPIFDLNIGDMVKSVDNHGNIVDSEVVAILHKHNAIRVQFMKVLTEHNATITLTKKHLLYVKNREGYIGADQVNVNDIIEIYDEKRNKLIESRVVSIDDNHHDYGYITPLTDNGVILVNNVHASCFAHVTSHQLSLLSMKPFIFAYKLSNYLNISTWFNTIDNTSSSIHFYAKYLLEFAQNYLSFFLIY